MENNSNSSISINLREGSITPLAQRKKLQKWAIFEENGPFSRGKVALVDIW